MVATWHTPEEGKHNGTIACTNGHVHLRDIPPNRKADHDDALRELSNALPRDPGTVEQAKAFLTAVGAKPVDLGNHVAYGALPEDWKKKLEDATKAVAATVAAPAESATLEELKTKEAAKKAKPKAAGKGN